MKKSGWIFVIIAIVLAIVIIFFVLTSNKGNNVSNNQDNLKNTGPEKCNDPPCLGRNFQSCTPAELTMTSGNQSFKMTVYGLENEKCHFSMVMNGITAANCYFKQQDLNDKVFNQMFGNPEGQDAIIAEACGTA